MMKIECIAKIGKDAAVNQVNGKTVINFNVAHNERYKNSDGDYVDKATWIHCAWWTEKTDLAKYIKKGCTCYIEGKPETKTYKKDDGEIQAQLHVRISVFSLITSPNVSSPNV
jgi:single-strand DNA-binding protein